MKDPPTEMFRNFSTVDTLPWSLFVVRAVLCTVAGLAASLTSTR